jgi:putative NADPH-quinone reductase
VAVVGSEPQEIGVNSYEGTMGKHITIIQGHPDSSVTHYGHALADHYAEGATDAGHEVKRIEVARIEFPLLRTKEEFEKGLPPEPIARAQQAVVWADHLVILYPLWLGSMPALLKGFLEQVFRPNFAFVYGPSGRVVKKCLGGKTARIIVTMGMPALVYRWFFFAHSLKNLERNILSFCGIGPIKASLIGLIEGMTDKQRAAWLAKMAQLGRTGK